MGPQKQAQLALLVLLASLVGEIGGDPFETRTSERHRVLPFLEISALLVLWGTMWAGTMIYTSGAGEEGAVVFLTLERHTPKEKVPLW